VLSHLEHHANIVPWQMLAERTGAVIKVIPVDQQGQLLLDGYSALLSDRTKLVAVTHVSNALGTVVPVERVIELGHRAGARILIDAAQSAPHLPIDVSPLDADFLAFSGHKLFGPTGIGVLYGKRDVLEDMPPWEGGGTMITDVTLERSTFRRRPAVSRPAPATSPTRWGWPRPSSTSSASACRTSQATSMLCLSTPPRACAVSWASAPLRAADPAPLRSRGHRPAVIRVLQHARRRSTRCWQRCGSSQTAAVDADS
jgi:cysteine desulfurase/selenocysteine lyase